MCYLVKGLQDLRGYCHSLVDRWYIQQTRSESRPLLWAILLEFLPEKNVYIYVSVDYYMDNKWPQWNAIHKNRYVFFTRLAMNKSIHYNIHQLLNFLIILDSLFWQHNIQIGHLDNVLSYCDGEEWNFNRYYFQIYIPFFEERFHALLCMFHLLNRYCTCIFVHY